MDLVLLDAEPDPAELAALDTVAAPRSDRFDDDLRVVYGGHAVRRLRHLLLPALDAVQSAVGWVSQGALNEICRRLDLPPAEAYSVASFYALLSTEPRPAVVAHVCDDICCPGGADLLAELRGRDDVVAGPCLGQCDRGPAVFIQRAGRPDLVLAPATADAVRAALAGEEPALPSAPVVSAGPVLARVGAVDPGSLDAYRVAGGYRALGEAIRRGPAGVVAEVKASNLRGRGGAAFPTGVKWEAVAGEPGADKYLVCNADESEPGTFKDRVVMEGDPFAVVEAMTIAGYAVGARTGYLYVRGEYPLATARLRSAIGQARDAGLLGENVAGAGFDFDIEVRRGQGAYICGEETALFNSIEGFRGEPRQKPPFPTQAGLFGRPTVVNNVETLVNIPDIVRRGGEAFAETGTSESTGTRLFCLSGAVAGPGVYEADFGATLGDLVERAGGAPDGIGAILLGGAAGSFVGPERLDLPLTFEATRAAGVSLGSGVIMVFPAGADLAPTARRIARFFRDESCGQCVPCRVGTVRVEEALDRYLSGGRAQSEVDLIAEMDLAMKDASICGLGHTATGAVRSLIGLGLL